MRQPLLLALSLLCLAPCHRARAENIVFPRDAGVVNVKLQYGARGDGRTDDTRAIQKAIDDHPNQGAIIYLPRGTYLISDTLRWSRGPRGGSEEKDIILQGQSRQRTVVKLKDRCPGFRDPERPKALVWTGERPAQRFRNAIRNLTLDTGRGNPGAIGAQFMANNQGTLREVTLRSGDGTGPIGLDLGYTDEQGPCLIKNVRVTGFDVGVSTRHAVDSVVLENVTLDRQNRVGLRNDGQCLSLRKLTSRNAVPALENLKGSGLVALVGARLAGLWGSRSRPAIRNEAALYARDVLTSGYSVAVRNTAGTGQDVAGRNVGEFVSHPVLSLFPSPPRALRLPVRETPQVPWDDLRQWASPTHFGGRPDDGKDDTAALQAALDSGKPTIYLPRGTYHLGGTLHLRGRARRIIGCEASLEVIPPLRNRPAPLFRFEDGASPVAVMERFRTSFVSGPFYFLENAARRTLVLSSVSINFQGGTPSYRNSGRGDLFIEDVVGGDWRFEGQRVWARQFNVENLGTHVTNRGGDLWILGLKTERGGTLIHTLDGGRTELLGGFSYTTTAGRLAPMFVNDGSSVSLILGESWFNREDSPYEVLVRETRGGETRELRKGDAPGRTGGSMLPLYTGYPPHSPRRS